MPSLLKNLKFLSEHEEILVQDGVLAKTLDRLIFIIFSSEESNVFKELNELEIIQDF